MSDIPTWHQRAMRHPDHQTGMVSEDMIRARMGEEISDLRAEIARLREALGSIAANTCCDQCKEAALAARAALENGR